MMTSKERAELKAQANRLQPILQVGKGGVTPAVVTAVQEAFQTRELLKVKALLETIPEPAKALAEKIAAGTGAEVVQVIGGSMILYLENPELREGKKKKPVKIQKPTVGIRARQMKKRKTARANPQRDRRTARKGS